MTTLVSYAIFYGASLVAQPAVQETQVQSLNREDLLEKELPTSIFLPGESHQQRRLAGYSMWGRKESDKIERLNMHNLLYFTYFNR